MLKKIILSLLITLISLFFTNINNNVHSYTGDTENNIASTGFTIHVNELSPGGKSILNSTTSTNPQTTMLNILALIIENLMVAIGVIAILVMTIGGGYMIMHLGQDDMLTKGKSIFKSGLIALLVALGSGLLVKLVAFLLYTV